MADAPLLIRFSEQITIHVSALFFIFIFISNALKNAFFRCEFIKLKWIYRFVATSQVALFTKWQQVS